MGGKARVQEGVAYTGQPWGSVVLRFSRMDLSIELSQSDLNAAGLGHTVVTFCGFLASLGAVCF